MYEPPFGVWGSAHGLVVDLNIANAWACSGCAQMVEALERLSTSTPSKWGLPGVAQPHSSNYNLSSNPARVCCVLEGVARQSLERA